MTPRTARWLENEQDLDYPYPVVFIKTDPSHAQLMSEWLRTNVGNENLDWAWTHGWWGDTLHCFRFKDQCSATFFRLTWQQDRL